VLPKDFENFRRIKGPRMKQVKHDDVSVPVTTPLLLEGSNYASTLNSEIVTVKDVSHIPKCKYSEINHGAHCQT